MVKSITFVNRHYPPNLNVTGENVWDITKYLIEVHGIDVHIVHVDRNYTGGGYKRQPIGVVHKVKSIYTGDHRILRYLAGLWDGFFLIRKAKKLNKGPIVVLTSPPLLPMWASLLLRQQDWRLWSMDLFPEGFGAINELKKDGWFYKYSFAKTYQNAPKGIIALGPNQKKNIESKYNQTLTGSILPCGVFKSEVNKHESLPHWKKEPSLIYFGYCGNCGIPHNPNFVKAAIDHLDISKHRMVLVVYGVYAEEIKLHAKDKPGVILLDNVPRHELPYIDVHMITLLPSWTHIAVPSKAVSSVCSGASFIFCGNKESDNWQLLQEAGWHVNDDENMANGLKQLMKNITKDEIADKRNKANAVTLELNSMVTAAYDEIASWAN